MKKPVLQRRHFHVKPAALAAPPRLLWGPSSSVRAAPVLQPHTLHAPALCSDSLFALQTVPSSLPLWPLSEGKLHTPALTQSCPRSPPAETPTFLAHHRMAGLSDNWGLQRPSLPPAPGHSLQALWVGVPQASRLWPPPHIRTEGQSPPLTCVSPVSGSARGR